jgi:hypothetical protein
VQASAAAAAATTTSSPSPSQGLRIEHNNEMKNPQHDYRVFFQKFELMSHHKKGTQHDS